MVQWEAARGPRQLNLSRNSPVPKACCQSRPQGFLQQDWSGAFTSGRPVQIKMFFLLCGVAACSDDDGRQENPIRPDCAGSAGADASVWVGDRKRRLQAKSGASGSLSSG